MFLSFNFWLSFSLTANGGGMKSLGLRASFLSSYTELDAWQNA